MIFFGGMGQAGGEKSSQYLANLCDRFPLQKKKKPAPWSGGRGTPLFAHFFAVNVNARDFCNCHFFEVRKNKEYTIKIGTKKKKYYLCILLYICVLLYIYVPYTHI
jgi:hypothetical protein